MRDSGNKEGGYNLQSPQRQEFESLSHSPPLSTLRKRIAVATAVIVLLAIIAGSAFVVIFGIEEEDICKDITGSGGMTTGNFAQVEATSPATAYASIYSITCDPPPTKLKIMLGTEGLFGVYSFPNNASGTTLVFDRGDYIGEIVYHDTENNGRVEPGDFLMISKLNPGTEYWMKLLWKDGTVLDSRSFSTPTN